MSGNKVLSREEILAMSAGRELDVLVAEKVMGYTIVPPNTTFWKDDAPFPFLMHNEEFGFCLYEKFEDGWPFSMFNPSADISAAWEVVEKMKRNDWVFVVNSITDKWTALFHLDRIHEHEVTCNSAPESICKAALLAVMNGGDNQ